jgi:group I intron endonuclease
MGYIYKITNKIDNKLYIGQTINDCEERWRHHLSKGSNCRYLSAAIKKYGVDSFEFKLVCITFDNNLDDMEINYIKQYNCLAPNGYNLRLGGNSGRHNIETKQKISDTLKTKFKNGFIRSNPPPQLGKPHNEITKKKISETLKGHKKSQTAIDKGIITLRIKRNRKIIQFDIEGNRLNSFDSCKEAAEYVGSSLGNISNCCLGRQQKTANGYIWKYESII